MSPSKPFLFSAFFAGILFVYPFGNLHAQAPPQNIADSLQSILNHSLPTNFTAPGVIMRVNVPGQWTWQGAAGNGISGTTAGQSQTTATATDRFRTGSVTKMMIATCILKLEQDGLLSIEDPIANYLRPTLVTDTINSSGTVLIRHLLNHTSGIANSAANNTCQLDVLTNPLNNRTLEEAIYCGATQGELFPPGTNWTYSNTNYSLLAMIISNVSGMDYKQYLQQTIFTPLNMSQTEIPQTNDISGPHMGCYWNIPGLGWTDLTIINASTYAGWADVVTSTNDLITFYDVLRNGQLINSTEWGKMQTIDPAANAYGLGFDFYTFYASAYNGHYGEVANTSGLFFGDIQSTLAPNGYFISYNFNTQGADMQNKIDKPVMNLLKNGISGLTQLVVNENLLVYPNPSNDIVTISIPTTEQQYRIELADLNGRKILHTQNASGQTIIDTKEIPNGTYLLTVENNQTISRQKLIIQHP